MKWTIEPSEAGMNVRDYLQTKRGFSRRILISAKSNSRGILVNGEEVTVRKILSRGDLLEVDLPPENISPWLLPEDMPLDIVYEDDYLLVINKSRGIASMTSPQHKSGTLSNAILGYYQKIGNPNTIHVVTRLDRDTSGLVLIAKDRLTHSLLAKEQQMHQINRKYLAAVHGVVIEDKGTIDAPIARKAGSIVERAVDSKGQRAVTHYKVKQRWQNYTLVEIELETGRTHQIRVHFSHINHPLVGDDLYGGKKCQIRGQALHCETLRFEDVYTEETREFHAKLPNDFKRLIDNFSDELNQNE